MKLDFIVFLFPKAPFFLTIELTGRRKFHGDNFWCQQPEEVSHGCLNANNHPCKPAYVPMQSGVAGQGVTQKSAFAA